MSAEHYFFVRDASGRNENVDTEIESISQTSEQQEEDDDLTVSTEVDKSDDIDDNLSARAKLKRKVKSAFRKGSLTSLLPLKKSSNETIETTGISSRESFAQLGKVLEISKKHHEKLNKMLFHRLHHHHQHENNGNKKHNDIDFNFNLGNDSMWTSTDNPLFAGRKFTAVEEEEKSDC
jgi:hypothetical protein